MDKLMNPFRPGAGTQPSKLFGREEELDKLELLIKRTCLGFTQSAYIVYGFRGVGKTVLLNQAQDIAKSNNTIAIFAELSENDNFKAFIFDLLKQALFDIDSFSSLKDKAKRVLNIFKSISLSYEGLEFSFDVEKLDGRGDSGTFQRDLVEALLALGETAKNTGKCICFILDELQYTNEEDKAALFAAMHRIAQRGLPISFVCAGLPQLLSDSTESKSYTERLTFIELGSLNQQQTFAAIKDTFAEKGQVAVPQSVLEHVYTFSQGYPFFIQQIGYSLWDVAESNPVTNHEFELAAAKARTELDNGFFRARYERATEAEREFMYAMAKQGNGPYKIAAVNKALNKTANQTSPIKSRLVKKGLIHSVDHGVLGFTVPQFADYILRRSDHTNLARN